MLQPLCYTHKNHKQGRTKNELWRSAEERSCCGRTTADTSVCLARTRVHAVLEKLTLKLQR